MSDSTSGSVTAGVTEVFRCPVCMWLTDIRDPIAANEHVRACSPDLPIKSEVVVLACGFCGPAPEIEVVPAAALSRVEQERDAFRRLLREAMAFIDIGYGRATPSQPRAEFTNEVRAALSEGTREQK